MCLKSQGLCEDVRELVLRVHIEQLASTLLDELPDVVIANIDVLRPAIMRASPHLGAGRMPTIS